MNKIYISWEEVISRLERLDLHGKMIYGVPKGGMILTAFSYYGTPVYNPEQADVILDDICDSGKTKKYYKEKYPNTPFIALYDKEESKEDYIRLKDKWIVFPWEADHPAGEENIQQNLVRQLQFIGEDPNREGLLETPNRIVKSWNELYSGYKKNPKDIMTTFDADGYDSIVLLKDIELYSMCEHHMLPFYGKAHVAYIPDKKIVGISKLARLVDIFARRLQIQERIGSQVTDCLMELLVPKGAACIIQASHMCMRMRGVSKQNSTMITSSMKGVFMTNPSAKEELMQLIKG